MKSRGGSIKFCVCACVDFCMAFGWERVLNLDTMYSIKLYQLHVVRILP